MRIKVHGRTILNNKRKRSKNVKIAIKSDIIDPFSRFQKYNQDYVILECSNPKFVTKGEVGRGSAD